MSEILRFMSREIYGGINQYTLDNAADRGTRVHRACEVLDKYRTVECEADIAPYVKAYMAFIKEHKPQWSHIECAMHHPTLMYAGTIDRAGSLNGKRGIVDIKAQEAIKKPLVTAQTNGYAEIWQANENAPVEALWCLQLKQDGTYRLHDLDMNRDTFMACYTLHKSLEKKPRKKKEDTKSE